MSDLPLIQAEHVSKKFHLGMQESPWSILRDLGAQIFGRRDALLRNDEFWALQDVSFELRRGDCLGVVGNNGAGKSTLLKLLMGRLSPTKGRISAGGRIAAISELGLGFNPLLSGRENIYVNAALLGMARKQTEEIFQDIVDFAGVGEFIEAPVRTYSTGMRARLGYSVAAHLKPEILLIDEVLAVGDVVFRRKCRQHIRGFIDDGGTMILISHDMQAIQTLCNRCLVLDKGKVLFLGDVTEGVHLYYEAQRAALEGTGAPESRAGMRALEESSAGGASPVNGNGAALNGADKTPTHAADPSATRRRTGAVVLDDIEDSFDPLIEEEEMAIRAGRAIADLPVAVLGVTLRPLNGGPLRTGADVLVTLHYRSDGPVDDVVWGFTICTGDGAQHIASGLFGFEGRKASLQSGYGKFRAIVRRWPFHPGVYKLKAGMGDASSGGAIAELGWGDDETPFSFVVESDPSELSNMHAIVGDLVKLDVEW